HFTQLRIVPSTLVGGHPSSVDPRNCRVSRRQITRKSANAFLTQLSHHGIGSNSHLLTCRHRLLISAQHPQRGRSRQPSLRIPRAQSASPLKHTKRPHKIVPTLQHSSV